MNDETASFSYRAALAEAEAQTKKALRLHLAANIYAADIDHVTAGGPQPRLESVARDAIRKADAFYDVVEGQRPRTMENILTAFSDAVMHHTAAAPRLIFLHPRSYRVLLEELPAGHAPLDWHKGIDFTVGYATLRIEPDPDPK